MVGHRQYTRDEVPGERKVRVDTFTNYAIDNLHEVPFNFPLNYDPKDMSHRSINVFDRLSLRLPRNRLRRLRFG